MDDPNINMEEYIRLEEEKSNRRGKVYNWETAKYGKIWYDEDVHDLRSVEAEFPTIVFNDKLTSEEALSCVTHNEEEQNVVYFNDLFPFNIIYPDDLESDKDNNDNEIDIIQSSGGNVINTDDGAYAQRTAKLRNDILMFQQHQGESLSEAWTRFKDLLQKIPHHGIDRWLQNQIFYDHVSFHLKCEIDRAVGGKLRDKNADESWEIIENLDLYDHEGWNDSSDSVKPVKAISTPQSTPTTPDRRLLKLEDQINFLLKGSRPTPRPSSTYVPQAYAEAVYSDPHPRNLNEPPKQDPFTFRERTSPNP
ncbi:zinc finger, CCHC-type containing protein [Tanacetum coccineum]|uniref:Zinc finger, CCHC-type containing protein n=1 Tax=Tanacetum coccineum TaxID=301880 RepID=A0ABQ4ZMP6_9ASTR